MKRIIALALSGIVACGAVAPTLAQQMPPPRGPELLEPLSDLDAAIECRQPLTPGARAVLLVHG